VELSLLDVEEPEEIQVRALVQKVSSAILQALPAIDISARKTPKKKPPKKKPLISAVIWHVYI
jgi:hypothetical protein